MSKRSKPTKAKDQRDLTELWQSNMQKDQELNDMPSSQNSSLKKNGHHPVPKNQPVKDQ